jgi:hypothetical protein
VRRSGETRNGQDKTNNIASPRGRRSSNDVYAAVQATVHASRSSLSDRRGLKPDLGRLADRKHTMLAGSERCEQDFSF